MSGRTEREIRARFPALATGTVFLENAGGSQVPRDVIERVSTYFRESYVQLGAGYRRSDVATQTVDAAHEFVATLTNCRDVAVPILGSSSTVLLHVLAGAYAPKVRGREIIVSEAGHEANVGPWVRLEAAGAVIRWWRVNERGESSLAALESLLNDRTALVVFPHVSNLLGGVVDVREITRLAHARGARVVVDGVAYAPHRAIDVAGWGADWYAYSTYKVYGPHLGALVGRRDAIAELVGPNHFFVPEEELPYKWELGGVPHESCAALLGTRDYLAWLGGSGAADRATLERAFAPMERREATLTARLLAWLVERGARIVGPGLDPGADRVGTVSFLAPGRDVGAICAAAHAADVGIRSGHMYAYRLCEAMGIAPADGVVRVSLVHYTSDDDLDRLFDAIGPALG
ncbi:MAG: aminotransferase class V-fold PLP-dependent enzyme [bacterium]